MRVLLVEDDRVLAQSLKKFLEMNGIKVELAYSFSDAVDLLERKKYDLYVLDVNLGDGDGIDLLEDLRRFKDDTPTIFISALTDIKNVTRGFNAGAEDYIKKPFDPEELVVRIKARIRKQEEELRYGDVFYREGRFFKGKEEIELGEVQRNILHKLLRNRGRVVTKEELYDYMVNPSSLALRVMINKLKKKTGIEIKSVRGLGYTID
ncbi:DNA-binding response OmpR family regulator [Hydrogenivirga caldilitoris]|uniref:DNA-binding response OmpR family regulator n=1 Tax=Hydrogenivirga caldilitoris TaxID=246264 RepID=A0A497XNI4_9AQUI|nr:response regulator transcription factor [Hydrogenivirga caldilitoris]RLJ70507.1 DNA-binding response OmpR family regulator [Hydrogenivirga caldilitoris]